MKEKEIYDHIATSLAEDYEAIYYINLENRKSFSYKYRIMVNGEPRHFQFSMLKASDNKHIILFEKDIEDEITAENLRLENQLWHSSKRIMSE